VVNIIAFVVLTSPLIARLEALSAPV
jgi:hypothetical protein